MLYPMGGPLRIERACDADFEAMSHVEGGRACASCGMVVHDLTRASKAQAIATALVFGGGGRRVCGRMRVDEDGFGVFPDAVRARAREGRRVVALVAAMATQSGCAEPSQPAPKSPPKQAPERCSTELTGHVERHSTPEVASAAPSNATVCPDGSPGPDCPKPRVVVTSSGDMVIMQHVTFAAGSSKIAKAELSILDAAVMVVQQHPEIRHLVVEGHADEGEKGVDALSLARAKAALKYMVERGVNEAILEARGAGSTKPIASPSTADGRARNRRIDFLIEER